MRTIDDSEERTELLDLGVGVLLSDRPDLLRDVLRLRAVATLGRSGHFCGHLAECHRKLGDLDRAREHLRQGNAVVGALSDDGYRQMISGGLDRLAERLTFGRPVGAMHRKRIRTSAAARNVGHRACRPRRQEHRCHHPAGCGATTDHGRSGSTLRL